MMACKLRPNMIDALTAILADFDCTLDRIEKPPVCVKRGRCYQTVIPRHVYAVRTDQVRVLIGDESRLEPKTARQLRELVAEKLAQAEKVSAA